MHKRLSPTYRNGFSAVELLIILVVIGAVTAAAAAVLRTGRKPATAAVATQTAPGAASFNYGFDFSDQEPDEPGQNSLAAHNNPAAVTAAKSVLARFAGAVMDQSLYSHGADSDPEPAPGSYDLRAIAPRIDMITQSGGIAMMTFINAPAWMHPSDTTFDAPPDPAHYQDYAQLCAYVAKSFPEIKYFAVWAEMRHFAKYDPATAGAANYTQLYNAIYSAVKKVRPDAMVGGPYADLTSRSTPFPYATGSTLHGNWGYVSGAQQSALTYWLAHKVGADFVAVDGATVIAKTNDANYTDAVTAAQKYVAVDDWIRSQTSLPIWWMESHIAPASGWNEQQGAAARVATLLLMNGSGAAVGMQWQPQDQYAAVYGQQAWPDEGLWTSVLQSGGGQPTVLANELLQAMPVLRQRLTLASHEPAGTVVATSGSRALLVNTLSHSATVTLNGSSIMLNADQVLVR